MYKLAKSVTLLTLLIGLVGCGGDSGDDGRMAAHLDTDIGARYAMTTLSTKSSYRSSVYRFYNSQTGAHFYTISAAERDYVIEQFPAFTYEGVRFEAYSEPSGSLSAVYRFYNTRTGAHFYTMSAEERDHVIATWPEFRFEGVAWYAQTQPSGDARLMHRFYNEVRGVHFYTVNQTESDIVRAEMPEWSYEGGVYYAWPEEPSCRTTLTGIIRENATYQTSDSPFCISSSLQIPAGVTVTFNPGTSIKGGAIMVQGGLSINGSSDARVRVSNVQIIPAGSLNSNHSISIAFADISGGTLYAPTGNSVYGSLRLTDSRIVNLDSYMYIWYPRGVNLIARNVFANFGGISYGLSFYDKPNVTFSVLNNHFSNWTGGAVLWNWVEYGSTPTTRAIIRGNTFADTSRVAVSLPGGYDSAHMDASLNYWGTTDVAIIERMIHDNRVDITANGSIAYAPFLTAPAPETPIP